MQLSELADDSFRDRSHSIIANLIWKTKVVSDLIHGRQALGLPGDNANSCGLPAKASPSTHIYEESVHNPASGPLTKGIAQVSLRSLFRAATLSYSSHLKSREFMLPSPFFPLGVIFRHLFSTSNIRVGKLLEGLRRFTLITTALDSTLETPALALSEISKHRSQVNAETPPKRGGQYLGFGQHQHVDSLQTDRRFYLFD